MSYICKKCQLKKILIIRFSSIGDIVLTTPVIRCVKERMPGTELHFAVKKAFYPVISQNPYIDKFHILEDDLKGLIRQLKKEKFDYIVDLHGSLRSRYIRSVLRRPSRGFPKLNFRKWLLTRLKIDLMPPIHIVDRYFRAAEKLGVKNDSKGLDYFIPPEDEYSPERLPEQFREGFVAFVAGAKHATKRLPVHKIVSICKRLNKPVVLLGGKEDAPLGEEIEKACGPLVVSLCGKLNINQSASLVRQADAVITHDTGLMHVAAAFRKHLISIWGNTVPALGMYPYMPNEGRKSGIIEIIGLPCRPCSKLGYDRCPKGHFKCMEEISEERIVGQLDSWTVRREDGRTGRNGTRMRTI